MLESATTLLYCKVALRLGGCILSDDDCYDGFNVLLLLCDRGAYDNSDNHYSDTRYSDNCAFSATYRH